MGSNYLLPEGNVQIAFSGGRTSGYMLYKILEANNGLPDRAKVIFTNTGREMPETYDFIQECFTFDGGIKDKIYPKTPSKWTCNFCPFKEEQELCGAGLDFA